MITNKEIEQMIVEEYKKTQELGIWLNFINPKTEFELTNNNTIYGRIDINTGFMWLNKDFVENAPKNEVRAVIAHEVCHLTQESHGHDKEWRKSVRKVLKTYKDTYENGEYHLNEHPYGKKRYFLRHFDFRTNCIVENGIQIPIHGLQRKEVIRKTSAFKYIVKCPCCGHEFKYKRKGNVVKHPSNYVCGKCNTQLERIQ